MSQISHRQRLRDAGRLKVNQDIDLSFRPGAVSRVTITQQEEFATRHLAAPQEIPSPFMEELPPSPPPPSPPSPSIQEPLPLPAEPIVPPPLVKPAVPPPPVESTVSPPVESMVPPSPGEFVAPPPTGVTPPAVAPTPLQEPPADAVADEPAETDGTEEM